MKIFTIAIMLISLFISAHPYEVSYTGPYLEAAAPPAQEALDDDTYVNIIAFLNHQSKVVEVKWIYFQDIKEMNFHVLTQRFGGLAHLYFTLKRAGEDDRVIVLTFNKETQEITHNGKVLAIAHLILIGPSKSYVHKLNIIMVHEKKGRADPKINHTHHFDEKKDDGTSYRHQGFPGSF